MQEVLIVALIVYVSWKEWLHYNERKDMAKLMKAKDLGEVSRFVFPDKKKPVLQETSNLVELDGMPDDPDELQGK